MITTGLDPYDPMSYPPSQSGDVLGFYTACIIVALVIVLGAISMIQWRDRSKVGDSFADDFIPDRTKVGATLASKPDMRGKR